MSEKRANRVLGIVVAAIAVVALIAVFAVKEPTAELDKGSPEGVVQQYLNAAIDKDFDRPSRSWHLIQSAPRMILIALTFKIQFVSGFLMQHLLKHLPKSQSRLKLLTAIHLVAHMPKLRPSD
jgi:hypothetical protein